METRREINNNGAIFWVVKVQDMVMELCRIAVHNHHGKLMLMLQKLEKKELNKELDTSFEGTKNDKRSEERRGGEERPVLRNTM